MISGYWRTFPTIVATALLSLPLHSQDPSAKTLVFKSGDGSFRFAYKCSFRVCTAGKTESCGCDADASACVMYPARRLEAVTNFGGATFEVREAKTERESMTPDVCVTPRAVETPAGVPSWPEFLISAQHPAETIGGVLFVHGIWTEGGLSHSKSVNLYRTFHRNKCYELSISQSYVDAEAFDPPSRTLTKEQQKRVDDSLSQILHSFRFLR